MLATISESMIDDRSSLLLLPLARRLRCREPELAAMFVQSPELCAQHVKEWHDLAHTTLLVLATCLSRNHHHHTTTTTATTSTTTTTTTTTTCGHRLQHLLGLQRSLPELVAVRDEDILVFLACGLVGHVLCLQEHR